MKRLFALISALVLFALAAKGAEPADKYLGYVWKPVKFSCYAQGRAPQIEENLEAFNTLAKAEQKSADGKYMTDLIDGFWFYAISHAWSSPEETSGKLPSRYGQSPTPTSLKTAALIEKYWKVFSEKINARAPELEHALRNTFKRITGKELQQ